VNVILKDNVEALGKAGDMVKVSDGYARNFLIPKGLAVEASSRNLNVLQHEKNRVMQSLSKEKKQAESLVERLSAMTCTIVRKVGEQGKLFGSVNTKDIEIALHEQGLEIDRKNIVLEDPIKSLGEFPVKVKLHPGVSVDIKCVVVADN
jgi:large subunit ribosomal protein L9